MPTWRAVTETPTITVVLAHMAGASGFDKSTQEASEVYAKAIARHNPHVRKLYFDACISATATEAPLLAQRIVKSESPESSMAATLLSMAALRPTLSRAGASSLSLPESSAPSKRTSPLSCCPSRTCTRSSLHFHQASRLASFREFGCTRGAA